MNELYAALAPPRRVLLGPGPSEVEPSVQSALSLPTLGHLDPWLLAAMDEIRAMLREALGTSSDWTLAASGTGTSGMEAVLANVLEPGDSILVGACGYFGARIAEIAERHGARVTLAEGEWGRALDPERVRAAAAGKRYDALALVHAETSTGILQDLAPFRELAGELGALLLVDAVTSLACVPLDCDSMGIDGLWSCTQKGLSCASGLAPLTLGERARRKVAGRARRPSAWYLDLELLMRYWGGEHAYHHTISSNLLYGLHEALRLVLEEGLEPRFARHRRHGRALASGLEAMGLELLAPEAERMPQLAAVRVPAGLDESRVRRRLLDEHGIEIGGGLGPLKGRLWRIGLMGAGSTPRNVLLALAALLSALAAEGFKPRGDPLEAAGAALAAAR
ncbi:MAG TPA: aminotransferase class V-fold PLP-dependent enzyme [Planctomycetota bacterium]|nr:aminotransferase class V-fold PLP-dependent enzyme [Planctomycetota bacterium]